MPVNARLEELLERLGIEFEVVRHRRTETTGQAAQTAHVTGLHVAKAVVMRDTAGSDFMVVLPASLHFDSDAVRRATGRVGVWLEDERELAYLFPDCELGAMPPVGHLYGLEMFVDPCLLEDHREIWFQAGNHRELIRMRVGDYVRVASPFVTSVCLHPDLASIQS